MTHRYRLEYRREYSGPFKFYATCTDFDHAMYRLREFSCGGRIIDRDTGRVLRAYSGFGPAVRGLAWWTE